MKPEYEEKFRALRTTLVGTDPEVRKQIKLDPEDEWLLDAFRWGIHRDRAVSNVLLHHCVLPNNPPFCVDHIDRDKLNNTHKNLRYATRRQNSWNARGKGASPKYKGVTWHQDTRKWVARVQGSGIRYSSYHDSETEAAKEYDYRVTQSGEYAYLNFPEDYGMPAHSVPDGKLRVDDGDAWLWECFKWRIDKGGYLRSSLNIARVVLRCTNEMLVDHMNRNPLDNRRVNLRLCTSTQNMRNRRKQSNNTSGYTGVWRNRSRWVAGTRCQEYGMIHHGLFDTPEEAAMARDDFVMKIDPVHCVLNFPERYHEGKRLPT